MYSPIRRNTRGEGGGGALSTGNCLRQVQENRQIIIKEGSKKDGRQEEADVKKIVFQKS